MAPWTCGVSNYRNILLRPEAMNMHIHTYIHTYIPLRYGDKSLRIVVTQLMQYKFTNKAYERHLLAKLCTDVIMMNVPSYNVT